MSHEVATGNAQTLEALSTVQAEIDQIGAWDASQRVDAILSRLKLPADSLMAECSGGIRRRAMLGQALVGEPDLLLLDEATNHLDIDSITALESALLTYSGAVLFITHDRTFIDGLATRIIELDRGTLNSYPGTHAEYLKQKTAELAAEEEGNRKFDQQLAEEEVWIRTGIKARRTRNEGHEPTNDLDVETLELLEELLSSFDGTLLLVSHDRAFLDQTVTSTLVLEGDGRIGEYVGGYSDWKHQADAARKQEAEARPKKSMDSRKPPERQAVKAASAARKNGSSMLCLAGSRSWKKNRQR